MRIAFIAASAALLLSFSGPSAAGDDRDFEAVRTWTFDKIPDGQLLEIKVRTGAGIRITAWDRDEITVATDWTEERCQDAHLEVTRTPQGVRIATTYPPGTGSINWNCSFDFVVRVPRRIDLQLASAGGGVAISGVRGDLRGHTGGGSLELHNLRGTISLRTGGGGILVRDSDLEGNVLTGGGKVRFTNVSGDITGRSGSMRGVVRGRSHSS